MLTRQTSYFFPLCIKNSVYFLFLQQVCILLITIVQVVFNEFLVSLLIQKNTNLFLLYNHTLLPRPLPGILTCTYQALVEAM